MTLAERMIVMNAGRMEQIGTPDEVYHRPATTFVAGFIGSPPMNLVRGHGRRRAASRPAASCCRCRRRRRAPASWCWACGPSTSSSARPRGAAGRCSVEALEMLGAERLVYGRSATTLFTARIDATACRTRRSATSSRSHAAPEHLHWFDAATTARVGA